MLGRRLSSAHAPLGAVLSDAGGSVLFGVVVVDGRVVPLVGDEEGARHGGRVVSRRSTPWTASSRYDVDDGVSVLARRVRLPRGVG